VTMSTEVISEGQRSLSSDALAVLLAASTVVVGLMAGFFYAYACSVMVGLIVSTIEPSLSP
jgi:uncharacterized oligopeptide transporter (OPT) family protein